MEEDNDTYIVFGTPLEPLEEDELPTKRPIQVQDQKVYDENGLQRFHGAFTGGFSAGYFNTVGTKEGWTPTEFVSSRSKKASKNVRRPEDFMDAEDLREFGIAPMRIHAKEQFRKENDPTSRSLDKQPQVIPGVAPLLDIVRPVTKSIGAVLLQKLGWRPGKGIGPKKMVEKSNEKMYGCALPPIDMQNSNEVENTANFMVSPNDVNILPYKTKNNVYGLGYVSLNDSEHFSASSLISESVSGHIKMGRGVKKVAFTGQAFGVGAFEDDDENIYGRDDLSKYDFSLEDEKDLRKPVKAKNSRQSVFGDSSLKGFIPSSEKCDFNKKSFPPPVLPAGYVPKNVFSASVTITTTTPAGTGRFLNRFAFSVVDRRKMLGNRFADSSAKPEETASTDRDKTQKQISVKEEIMDSSEITKQTEKVKNPTLKFQTVLNSKFVPSSTLEVEELAYGLSRPTVPPVSEKAEQDDSKTTSQLKCQRLVEVWHPVALLCKRFNVPDPHPDSETATLAAMSARPSQKPSIFRSLFEPVLVEQEEQETDKTVSQSTEPEIIVVEEDTLEKKDVSDSVAIREDVQREAEKRSYVSKSPAPEDDFKPPTPPTMDLFKAIFQDTSSDEANEPSDKSEDEDSQVPQTEKEIYGSKTSTTELTKTSTLETTEASTSEVTVASVAETSATSTPPDTSLTPQAEFYGPALPPAGTVSVKPSFIPRIPLADQRSGKRKAKKRKSHHKSHKKHKKKRMKYSKSYVREKDSDSDEDSSEGESDDDDNGDDKEVNLKLFNRLKSLKKR